MNEQQILRDLSDELTDLVRTEIRRQDLIDTGRLVRSIEVRAVMRSNDIIMDILAEDYFVFVDARYDVMNNVIDSRDWENAVENAIDKIIQLKIK